MRIHMLVGLLMSVACSGSPTTGSPTGTSTGTATGSDTTTSTSTSTSTSTATATSTSTATATWTSQTTDGLTLYGSPYTNVNMWYGPVDYAETQYHNGCGTSDGSKYPAAIQSLYGPYLIGLDGENVPQVESHCDNCAQLTANGKTIIAHIITYGIENGKFAIDLSPEAQTALGLSNSNWTGTWQFSSCPTQGTPIYYQFDARQWNPQNFWYMRLWTRNQRIPVSKVETQLGSGGWVAASQQSDGAWQTQSGVDFSKGFQVRVTGVSGQQLIDSIPAPTGINPANPLAGSANFP